MKLQSKLMTVAVASAILMGCAGTSANQVVSKEDGYRQFGNVVWDKTGTVATSFDNNTIPANQSRMVFIRSQEVAELQSSANIGIDDRFQVSLQGSNYSTVYACAGDHQININQTGLKTNDLSDNAKTYTSEAGETQYFFVALDEGNTPRLSEITEQSALTVLQNAPYSQQTHQVSRVLAVNCVAPVQEPIPEPAVKVEIDKPISLHVEFDFDKATIRPQYNARLAAVAKFMEEKPNTVALIEGHTDSRGNDDYNQDLSERRAAAVRQQLIARYGVNAERISSAGFGESRPVASNDTDEGRQRNRRVDALITLKK